MHAAGNSSGNLEIELIIYKYILNWAKCHVHCIIIIMMATYIDKLSCDLKQSPPERTRTLIHTTHYKELVN